jgi:hypothetical protein
MEGFNLDISSLATLLKGPKGDDESDEDEDRVGMDNGFRKLKNTDIFAHSICCFLAN